MLRYCCQSFYIEVFVPIISLQKFAYNNKKMELKNSNLFENTLYFIHNSS